MCIEPVGLHGVSIFNKNMKTKTRVRVLFFNIKTPSNRTEAEKKRRVSWLVMCLYSNIWTDQGLLWRSCSFDAPKILKLSKLNVSPSVWLSDGLKTSGDTAGDRLQNPRPSALAPPSGVSRPHGSGHPDVSAHRHNSVYFASTYPAPVAIFKLFFLGLRIWGSTF